MSTRQILAWTVGGAVGIAGFVGGIALLGSQLEPSEASAEARKTASEALIAAIEEQQAGGNPVFPTTAKERLADAARAKEVTSLTLRDPDSVSWGAIWTSNGVAYCGFYNAKNAYGAYVGFEPFFVIGDEVFSGDAAKANWARECESHPPQVVFDGQPGPAHS